MNEGRLLVLNTATPAATDVWSRPERVPDVAMAWRRAGLLVSALTGDDPADEGFVLPNDRRVVAQLETAQRPFFGSTTKGLSYADKRQMKKALAHAGLPTPAHGQGPWVIKPARGNSSCGVTVAQTVAEIEFFSTQVAQLELGGVIVESLAPGEEYTVAVLGNGSGRRAFAIEIGPKAASGIIDAKTKRTARPVGRRPRKGRRLAIERLALAAADCLHVRDWARLDIVVSDHDGPQVIDLNTMPGLGLVQGGPSPFTMSVMLNTTASSDDVHQALVGVALQREQLSLPRTLARAMRRVGVSSS